MSKAVQLDEQYWNNRYKTDQTGWDIGFVSTPLKEYGFNPFKRIF